MLPVAVDTLPDHADPLTAAAREVYRLADALWRAEVRLEVERAAAGLDGERCGAADDSGRNAPESRGA